MSNEPKEDDGPDFWERSRNTTDVIANRAAFFRMMDFRVVPGRDPARGPAPPAARRGRLGVSAPIPMLLCCPCCGERHVDEGEFASKPHHTHACQHCGMVWRPAVPPTVGVRFLPGFKDGDGKK